MAIQSLDRAQILSLLRAAHDRNRTHWLALLMAFAHGLRASELIGIKRDDIRDGFLTVQRLKGSLKTTQPLIESAEVLLDEKQAVESFIRPLLNQETLFKFSRFTFWRVVRKYSELAALPAHLAHPHVLKHSIAMQIIGTAGIENTRQYLGHKNISSTGAYLKVTDADASAAARAALSGSKLD